MADHAKLSASGSHIWLNCTPAIRMSEGIPDRSTVFTEEGTLAHRLAELQIRRLYGLISESYYEDCLKLVKASQFYTPELVGYVLAYTDWIEEIYNAVKAQSADHEILTEQRLDF